MPRWDASGIRAHSMAPGGRNTAARPCYRPSTRRLAHSQGRAVEVLCAHHNEYRFSRVKKFIPKVWAIDLDLLKGFLKRLRARIRQAPQE